MIRPRESTKATITEPQPPPPASVRPRRVTRWRGIVDWAKHRDWVLRLATPLSRGRGRWRFVDRVFDHAPAAPVSPRFDDWTSCPLAACWLGHATVLLRVGGVTILTDPVFSTRVGLGWGFGTLGPARLVQPAIALRELPPIDLVLISHAHFDHLDRPTLSRLARRSTSVVCAAGCGDLLDDLGFRSVRELALDEDGFEVGTADRSPRAGRPCHERIKITAVPVRHWGARMITDASRGYCAFLIEATDGTRVLYGADSAYQEQWRPIGEQGGVDLAIVGIGAYDPWIGGHANPEQAWTMAAEHAGARTVLPMHHQTFRLSNEPLDEPLRRFLAAAGSRAGDVVCRAIGETWRGDTRREVTA